MESINKKRVSILASFAILTISLLSFSVRPGTDKIEIFLNNRLIVEQYISSSTSAKFLTLHQNNYNDKISVHYSHCGIIGKARKIVARDPNNKKLKEWTFANASTGNRNMSWPVKEIMDLQNGSDRATVKLYYFAAELPEGRLLATVVRGDNNYTKVQ
jgi:hypothetical protein